MPSRSFDRAPTRRAGRRPGSWGVALALLLVVRAAAAAEPLNADEPFKLDLFQGPVLGSTRVIGLGGAYTAIAEESVGIPFNAASVAHRTYYSVDRMDWDITGDFLIPGIFQGSGFDFNDNGRADSSGFRALAFGGQIQYAGFGVGVYVQGQLSEFVEGGAAPRPLDARYWLGQLAIGYGLFDNQLVLGAGVRVALFNVIDVDGDSDLFSTETGGVEVGAVWAPHRWPIRLGAAATLPVGSGSTAIDCSDRCPADFHMPSAIALPWEVRLGAAYRISWGSRPFNRVPGYLRRLRRIRQRSASRPASRPSPPRKQEKPPRIGWSIPQMDARYESGHYLLIVAEVVLNGSVDDAIGLDGFVEQLREPSGESLSVSGRLGAESEVWRRRLRLRAGGYWEPSRFSGRAGRLHGTFAFDLRLFDFRAWGFRSLRLSAAVDATVRYSNVSFSLGFWH